MESSKTITLSKGKKGIRNSGSSIKKSRIDTAQSTAQGRRLSVRNSYAGTVTLICRESEFRTFVFLFLCLEFTSNLILFV